MAIVTVFDGRDIPIDRYDAAVEHGGAAVWAPADRSLHHCYESWTGFVVVDVWECEEAFARFGEEVIGPAMAATGIEGLEPSIHPLHRVHRGVGDANAATVATIYEAFGRGDIPAILEHLSDDIDWEGRSDDHGIPWLRPGRGKAHVVSFFESLAALELKRFEPTAILGGGDTVVALIDAELVVRDTGRTVDQLEAHVWTFDDAGLVRAFRHMVDTAAHLHALQR
jgi:ketosteroid isomerase-like protein